MHDCLSPREFDYSIERKAYSNISQGRRAIFAIAIDACLEWSCEAARPADRSRYTARKKYPETPKGTHPKDCTHPKDGPTKGLHPPKGMPGTLNGKMVQNTQRNRYESFGCFSSKHPKEKVQILLNTQRNFWFFVWFRPRMKEKQLKLDPPKGLVTARAAGP